MSRDDIITVEGFLRDLGMDPFLLQFERVLKVRNVANLTELQDQHLGKIGLSDRDRQLFLDAVHGPAGLAIRLGLHRPTTSNGTRLSQDPRNQRLIPQHGRVGARPQITRPQRNRSDSLMQGVPAAQKNSVIEKCAEAVQKYMTPAAENAFWYLRSIDHIDAQKQLDGLPGGSFVIRLTSRSIGSFVMAYRHLGRVQNRYAKGSAQGLCFEGHDSQYFQTLESLVKHYSTNQQAALKAFKLVLRLTPPTGHQPQPSLTSASAPIVRPQIETQQSSKTRPKVASPPVPPVQPVVEETPEVFGFDVVDNQSEAPPIIPPRTVASQGDPWFTKETDAWCKRNVNNGVNGTFAVRTSSTPGCYVLCVKDNGVATNYLIKSTAEGYHFAERVFDTVPDIIENFLSTPFLAESGITMKLTAPVPGCGEFNIGMQRPESIIADNFWLDWQLDHGQIEMGTLLGQGEFGEVWAGELQGSGEFSGMVAKVAIKQLKQDALANDFLKEAEVMIGLDHDNLVKIYGITMTSPRLIVSELCEHGNLKDNLMARYDDNTLCTEREFLQYAHDIAAGMTHLTTEGYVHRDLACRNVLVSASDVCKVADFGLARLVKEEIYEADRNSKMPIRWTAPESILRGTFSAKSDVFSYGVTLYEIVTHGEIPYPGMTNKEVLEHVIKKNERNQQPSDCSNEMWSLMELTWRQKPADRPNFSQIYDRLTQLLDAE